MPQLPALVVTLLLTVALPFSVIAFMARGDKAAIKTALLGGATFFVFQYLLRIPLIRLLSSQSLSSILFSQTQPVLYALVLSLSAALFEEGGRYLVMRRLVRRYAFRDGFIFGVGHGGIESFLLVGLPTLALIISPMELSGALVLISAAERVFAMVIHVAFSLMVMQSVKNRRIFGLLAAFALHTLVNFITQILQVSGYPVYVVELFILGFMFFMLGYIIYIRMKETDKMKKEDAA